MNLLRTTLYDPVTAASQVTTSLLPMTALDTTNLRHSLTVPAHGYLRFKLSVVHHASTTIPQLLLGIMEGSTVLARIAPNRSLAGGVAASAQFKMDADFTVNIGAGAKTLDFAFGVEAVASAGGALKWGGPDNLTGDDAFGGVLFEIWDPQPQTTDGQLIVSANGRVIADSVAGNVDGSVGWVIGDVYGNVSGNINGNVQGNLNGEVIGSGSPYGGLTEWAMRNIAQFILAHDLAEGINGNPETDPLNARTVRSALRFIRNKWTVANGVLTVKKEDDAGTAWTSAIAVNASAKPIVGSDPT